MADGFFKVILRGGKVCFFGNFQAAKKGKIILKSNKKERTSFCEQKEAKKL